MDVQIGKLNEGMKQVARADDTLSRTEKLAAETSAQLESATKLRQETERETGKLKKGSDLAARRGPRPGRHAGAEEEGVRGVRRAPPLAAVRRRRRRVAHGSAERRRTRT
jgi:hypothetical protein